MNKISIKLMARIAVITALFCILAPFSIPLPFSPVPLSLTNFVIFISLFVLPWKAATLSCILYLLIGLVGLPVFSGFSGGIAKIAGPTGGYLLGFIPLIIIAGLFMNYGKDKSNWYIYYLIGTILGEAVLYILGTAWLAHGLSVSFSEALFMGVIPYLPGDAAKLVIAMYAGAKIRKALTRALASDPLS